MDIESLRTFLVLAGTKNYTRASEQLFVAQSTVTNRIKELEREINIELFSRNNRNVSLTPAGEEFYVYAKKVTELTDSSLVRISSIHNFENQMRIGSVDSIYEGHLAPIIINHQKTHPNDALKVSIGVSTQLIEQLQDNLYDVIFTYLPLSKSVFTCEVFRDDPMVLVTDYNNKKFSSGISLQELVKENYIMCNFALQDVGQFIRGLFPKYHHFPLEIDDCSRIIPFLYGQASYTFLPRTLAEPYIAAQKLRMIPLNDLTAPVITSYIIGSKNKLDLWRRIFPGTLA